MNSNIKFWEKTKRKTLEGNQKQKCTRKLRILDANRKRILEGKNNKYFRKKPKELWKDIKIKFEKETKIRKLKENQKFER